MKVKRFSRKPMRITGSRYKRQQWKQREKMKGNSGGAWSRGRATCFKCGKPGHWARNCTSTGGFKNLGSFNGQSVSYTDDHSGMFEEGEDPRLLEEMGPYPTVEEAREMLERKLMKDYDDSVTPSALSYKIVEPFLELEDGKVTDG